MRKKSSQAFRIRCASMAHPHLLGQSVQTYEHISWEKEHSLMLILTRKNLFDYDK